MAEVQLATIDDSNRCEAEHRPTLCWQKAITRSQRTSQCTRAVDRSLQLTSAHQITQTRDGLVNVGHYLYPLGHSLNLR